MVTMVYRGYIISISDSISIRIVGFINIYKPTYNCGAPPCGPWAWDKAIEVSPKKMGSSKKHQLAPTELRGAGVEAENHQQTKMDATENHQVFHGKCGNWMVPESFSKRWPPQHHRHSWAPNVGPGEKATSLGDVRGSETVGRCYDT